MPIFEKEEASAMMEQLLGAYGRLMFHVANQILNHPQDAEDAVQQALISIYQNISKISDIHCPKTRAFVVIIVERKAIDLYRRKQRTAALPLEEAALLPARSDSGHVAQAIAALPAKYRELILLKYDLGYSDGEIAALLDMTEANVRKTLQRAKKKLNAMLQEGGELL